MIYSAIIKPTKECNAECKYCCTPPDGIKRWSIDRTIDVLDKLLPSMSNTGSIVFHGGEPMLMGVQYFEKVSAYIRNSKPSLQIGIQTNLLAYKSKVWSHVFKNVFKGTVSTSFEPNNQNRILCGSTDKYNDVFFNALNQLISDGIKPLVIGVFNSSTISDAYLLYEESINRKRNSFHIRLNYQYPMGRVKDTGPAITPVEYGELLVNVYNRWIKDAPSFVVTPLNQMLKICLTGDNMMCPWTNRCGGRFVAIDPDGSVFNCGLFSDLHDERYLFGNIFESDIVDLFSSSAAIDIRRRSLNIPDSCASCRHFDVCAGGCARDSVLYDNGLYGKFYYCESWKMVFDRIKQSIATGEADEVINMLHLSDPVRVSVC